MAKSKHNKNFAQMTKEQLEQIISRGGKRAVLAMNELVKRGVYV